jgi:hypothetical protein
MALVLADRVLETTTSTGSGTITLAGAKPGYQSFAAVGDGNTTYYTIAGITEWEVGIGTYTASGTTLSRDTVLASSDGGTKVTFSAGSKDVFVDYPAGRAVYGNANGDVVVSNLNATSATITTLTGTSANITTFTATSSNITTLSGTNFSAASLTLTNALKIAEGGTGLDTTPTNGQLLIGNGTGYALSTLTAGEGILVTNNAGSITIAAEGGGLPAVVVSDTTTISAVVNFHYVLTAASLTTVTLPASPTISDTIYVTVANDLTTNVVARNGQNIQGIAEDLTLNATYASVQLRFTDNTEGWIFA